MVCDAAIPDECHVVSGFKPMLPLSLYHTHIVSKDKSFKPCSRRVLETVYYIYIVFI